MADWDQDLRDARNAQTKCEEAAVEMDRELVNLEAHLERMAERIEELESQLDAALTELAEER